MTPKAPNSTAVTGGIKTSDPRIISPDIKVIYPSENVQKETTVSEVQTTAPIPQVLPTAPQAPAVPTKESTVVITEQTPTPVTTANTTEQPKVSNWKDTLKEHAGLFIAVALISVGIGYLIGKKV